MIPRRAAWRVRKPTAHPAPPSLDSLLEEGTDAIPVRITIVQDDLTTGWDDGALGFEDGAVWFSGRATSFRLAAPDILPGAYLLSRREAVTSGEALNQGFPLRHPTRGVWVRVRVLTKDKEEKAEHERRLIAFVKRLRAEPLSPPGERGRGEGSGSEYPPLVPRPGLFPAKSNPVRIRVGLVVGSFGFTTMIVGNVLATMRIFWPLSNFVATLGTAALFGSLTTLSDLGSSDARALRRIAEEEHSSAVPPPSP